MATNPDSPIKVVVFTGGPTLRLSIQRFILKLEAHNEIDLKAVYCESPGDSFVAVAGDLWNRRKWLAVPLLGVNLAEAASRYFFRFRQTVRTKRMMSVIRDRIHFIPDIHAPAVLESLRELRPDLGLIYGSPILKPELFQIPASGTLGIHHGKLPGYRGKKTTFWAMYNGESEAGVTIQKVNAGLDTGEIVQEGAVSTLGRSLGAVRSALEELGYALYLKAILEIKEGTASYRRPEGRKGKLLRDPKPQHLVRFFLSRLVRSIKSSSK